jgi:hypothetical protein
MQRRPVTRICYTLVLVLLLAAAPAVPAAAQRTAQAQPAPGQKSVLDDAMAQFQIKRGLDLLYHMKFEQAHAMFDLVDRRFPDHPIGPFLKALDTWWKILIDLSDDTHDAAFFAAMDEVIERSDRLLKRDPNHFDAMFFKGAALGFRGRLRSNRGDWWQSARDGMRAMDYVLGVAKKDPKNPDFAFGKGIYDYYADAVPERYPFVKPVMVFFPDGDKARGIQELERTAKEGRFIQTEAVYFLLQIYYLFEQDYDKSVEYVTWLREHYPDNAFFHAFEGRVYARWGHWGRAEEIFDDVLTGYKQKKTGYNAAAAEQALYFMARGRMAYADYPQALAHLNRLEALAARNDREGYFKVMGRLRLGMVYDALGQRPQAVARYRQVLQMKDWSESRARAKQFLEQPYTG